MTGHACPACGSDHAPGQRYCLGCGALVGRRPVELDQVLAASREHRAPRPTPASLASASSSAPTPPTVAGAAPPWAQAPDPTPSPEDHPSPAAPPSAAALAPAGDLGLWRRPATSILTAVALATGVAAGFLLEPQGGRATGAPVAASGQGAAPAATSTDATPATDPAATATADAPADAGPTSGATAPAASDADAPTANGSAPATTPVSAVASPSADDAATPSANDAATPTADDLASPTASAPSTAGQAASRAPKRRAAKAAPAARRGDADGAKGGTTKAGAEGLPRIEHVWVVGIDAPVAATDGGYLGETLLAAGTELPRYAPVSADPTLGAAALLAGRAPSADATTIVGQLSAAKRPWRAYAPGTPGCGDAPAVNPLLAFPSVTSAAGCADGVAGLTSLASDLARPDQAPAFSYVATDAHLDPAALDAQLQQVVEPIRRSAAYKRSGLIAIVPTAAAPGTTTGALVLSPFAAGSTSIGTAFGPYSLLRTFQDLLGLPRLGHAADRDVRGLGKDVLVPED